jgi:ABC-type branched-subunit amino acid transport system ATPase component
MSGAANSREASSESTDALVVTGLGRSFGGVQAVRDVSLTIPLRTATGIIGPNGAGKSTLLHVIAGSIAPSAGKVAFCGHDITGRAPHRIAKHGLIRTYQLSSEFKRLTVMENLLVAAPDQRGEQFRVLLLGARWWRKQERANVELAWQLLARFEMTDIANEYAGELSGGQRRLVEIMRALMARPRMLLLDEPMAGVNPTLARTVEAYLHRLGDQEGMTMLIVEHELSILERICDRVIVMADGAVIADGTMSEVREQPEVIKAYVVG